MSLSRLPNTTTIITGIACALLLGAACGRVAEQPAAATSGASDSPAYVPEATVKDLMQAVIDTSADTVWLSVTAEVSADGIKETKPTNEEDWNKVRHGALTLAESANLLMIPGRHVARPGEKSETPGVELEPEEMDVLINADRAAWNRRAQSLHDAAMLAVSAAEAHDAEKIFEVGSTIEDACESCHRQYWYPNEKIPEVPSL